MPIQHDQITMLRAEARFALLCGVILLALGLFIALAMMFVLPANPNLPAWLGFLLAVPPLAAGWGICHFASWRLEAARRLEEGGLEPPPIRSKLRAMKTAFRQRQRKA